MKLFYTAILFCLLMIPRFISGQAAYNDLNANNIKTGMHSNGPMFWDLWDGQFLVPFTGSNSPSAVYAGGLWMSGKDINGDTKLLTQVYNIAGPIFNSGPVNLESIDYDFNQVWKVTSAEVKSLIADYQDNDIIDSPPSDNLNNWPAIGNNIDSDQLYSGQFFAPFHDQNNDDIYNPNDGDYPVVIVNDCEIIPDEMLYTLYNSSIEDQPKVEVHSILYAFNNEEDMAVHNSVFSQLKVVSLEDEALSDVNMAFWMDMDIGCFEDDYIGCDVGRNSVFAYNAQDMDGFIDMCELDKVGYEDLPILSYRFLNQSLTKFAPYARSSVGVLFTSFPDTKEQKLNYLEGRWKDGTPFTEGNFGYNPGSIDTVDHLFPGDPTKEDEWSMRSAQLGPNDMAMIAINKKGLFEPKEIYTLDAVITYTNEPGYLTEIPLMQSNIDYLQSAYEECFTLQLDTKDLTPEASLKLYPNPARSHLKIESDFAFEAYKITDVAGQVIQKGTANQLTTSIQLSLAPGVYTISLSKDVYTIHKRLVVVE